MGSQIGCEFAAAGHDVAFVARSPAHAARNIEVALDVAERYLPSAERSHEALRRRIAIESCVDNVAREPQLVLESLAEDFGLKVELLGAAGARWSDAVLASNTSSLSITAIGEAIGAPRRTIGLHYWNPPLLMPLVEVVMTAETAPVVRIRAMEWLRETGKQPVLVARDVPGFIWNRLQFALLREALWLVEQDVADRATVDQVVREGLARRWRLTGPFETAELGGVETFARVADNLFPHLSVESAAPALREWVSRREGELVDLAERRDAALAVDLQSARENVEVTQGVRIQREEASS
jgi:3-hydroxybutyryl-CoA dehydrogenase